MGHVHNVHKHQYTPRSNTHTQDTRHKTQHTCTHACPTCPANEHFPVPAGLRSRYPEVSRAAEKHPQQTDWPPCPCRSEQSISCLIMNPGAMPAQRTGHVHKHQYTPRSNTHKTQDTRHNTHALTLVRLVQPMNTFPCLLVSEVDTLRCHGQLRNTLNKQIGLRARAGPSNPYLV